MVRLKEGCKNQSPDSNVYFNSTMVRLKEEAVGGREQQGAFQFHYGTIKR